MGRALPGATAISVAALLGLAAALLALAGAGAVLAVVAGVLVTAVSYGAAICADRAAGRVREAAVRPQAGDAAGALVRRTERSAAAVRTLLDTMDDGPVRSHLSLVRWEADAAVARAYELAAHYTAIRAPLAGLDDRVPQERKVAGRLAAAAGGVLDQLGAQAARLDAMVADLGELVAVVQRPVIAADGEERLRALRDALIEVTGPHLDAAAVTVESDVACAARPGTMKAPFDERTG